MFSRPLPLVCTLTLATLLLSGWSGCRFGNNVEKSPDPSENDPTGFYETQPERMLLVVEHSTREELALDLTSIPKTFQTLFTNPVALVIKNSAKDAIYDQTLQNYLPITALPDSQYQFKSTGKEEAFWSDACKHATTTEFVGKYEKYGQPVKTASGLTALGKTEIFVKITDSLSGDCTTDLEQMMSCYGDLSKCPGETADDQKMLSDYVHSLFDELIQANLMTPMDIEHYKSMGFIIEYK